MPKKKITTGRRDDQSVISSKEHVKYEATQTCFCQLRTNTTALGGKRLQQRSQGPQQQQSTPSSKESPRGKKTPSAYDAMYGTNACHSLTGFFRGYCRLSRGPHIPKYRVSGNSHLRDILCFFLRKDAVYLFMPGRDPPAATWPARTQHMTAQQHTQNQPLHA